MKEPVYILQIDTATPVCSVALSKDGETVQVLEQEGQNIHAEKLKIFIDQIVKNQKIELSDLSAVSVSKGPGSYTGLRIGVSTVKGLCYGLNLPMIAVDSLQALAKGYSEQLQPSSSLNMVLCPVIDARRMEVYQTLINASSFELLEGTQAQIVDEHTYQPWLDKGFEKVVLFGSGADKFIELFQPQEQIEVIEGFKSSAKYMSEESFARYSQQAFENIAYFEPLYLKDFIPTTPKKRL